MPQRWLVGASGLVVQQYVELVLLSALAWCLESWRPGLPTRSTSIASQLRLGGYFAAAAVLFYFADNVDRVLVGRLVGPDAVGLYSQAYNVMIKPVWLVTTPLVALMLTSLSRAAADPQARGDLVVAFYRFAAILLLPISVGLVVVGGETMQLLGGAAWTEAGPLLSVLSIGMVGQAAVILSGPVLAAAGRTGRLCLGAAVVAVVMLAAYLVGWWLGQLRGAPTLGIAWGYAVAVLAVVTVPYMWYCFSTTGHSFARLAAAVRRPLLAAIIMGVVVWLCGRWLPVEAPTIRLAVLVPLGGLIYALFAQKEVIWLVR